MMPDRVIDRMDMETNWLFNEGSINFWLHVIFAIALLGVALLRRQNIQYPIAYRMAVITFAFGWLLPVLTQWMLLSITVTFIDNVRRAGPPRELMFILPWSYVLGVCFKGISVILFVASLGFGRTEAEKPGGDPGRSIALDEH